MLTGPRRTEEAVEDLGSLLRLARQAKALNEVPRTARNLPAAVPGERCGLDSHLPGSQTELFEHVHVGG